MAKVACTILNGIIICKWKRGFDDGTGDGEAPMVKDGPAIRLNGPTGQHAGTGNPSGAGLPPAFTEVPDDWGFDTWLEQNKMNPYVAEGFISLAKDEVPNG